MRRLAVLIGVVFALALPPEASPRVYANGCYDVVVSKARRDIYGKWKAAVYKTICPKEGVVMPGPDLPDDGEGPSDGKEGAKQPRSEKEEWMDQHCVVKLLPTPPRIDANGSEWHEYRLICGIMSGGLVIGGYNFWAKTPPAPSPTAPLPPPSPDMLARLIWAEMSGQLPTPSVNVAPADTEPEAFAYVQVPTFFWVEPAEYQIISRTLTVGGEWLQLTITPTRVDVDLGNGDSTSCTSVPPFYEGADVETFDGCGYTYRHSSATAANGETFAVTATVVWQGSWTSSMGAGGSFPEVHMRSPTRELPVAEIQAIVTDVHTG